MRAVRLILIEYLRGECIASVDPHEIPRPVRSQILKKVLDAEVMIIDAGVNQSDLHPRNVILSLPGNSISALNVSCAWESLDIKVHIIDFNVSRLVDPVYKRYSKLRKKWPGRPLSHLVRHYHSMIKFSGVGWCSAECSNHEEEDEDGKWLWRHYKDDQRYFSIMRNTKSRRGFDPVYV
jgi:hypothetical protein